MDFKGARTETEFFAFQGGLDLATPALRIPPGSVISSSNYEPAIDGGYSRMKGYERFDGRTSPSSATASPAGAVTPAIEAQALVDAADALRTSIAAPTGSGAIRGVVYYAGSTYCFRDNAGGTAGGMWKSSGSGWTAVSLGEEVAFTNANTSVGVGDTLTQGSVTATVAKVIVQTGSLASGTNTGRLIITGRAGGDFTGAAATSTGGGSLTLSGVQTANALPPGGVYQFDIYNFGGATAGVKLYGANGVGFAFEFDGTTFAWIKTGAATDTPSFIKAHRKYLYTAQGSSVTNSSIGDPMRYVAGEGAVENAVGDTVTGLCSLPGEALGIMCRNSSFALVGSSSADWVTQTIRADVGAVPYTLATMSDTYMLDDRGITSVRAAQEYGNFADATLSRKIQPVVDNIRNKVVCGFVSRQKGHYVLYMNDGTTLTMGVTNGQLAGFLEGRLGFTPSCAWSGEDNTGVERIFVGATSGMVYEMDRGSTFDGSAIESSIKIAYNNSKSPRVRKRYRRVVLEMTAVRYAAIRFRGEFSYGDPDIAQTSGIDFTTGGSGGSWDLADWDEFFWDSKDMEQPSLSIDGVGNNMSFTFTSNTKLDFGHTLQGAILQFSYRRPQR